MGLKLESIAEIASEEGEWEEVPDWAGVRLKVRSINSRDYQQQRELLVQRRVKALNRLPTSVEMEPELGKLVSRYLLRGWEGIDGPDDKPLVWSPEVGLATLGDPKFRALEQQVIGAATRIGDRDAQFNEESAGN